MDGSPASCYPLTQADCDTLLRIVNVNCPQTDRELAEMEAAGMPVPAAREQNEANRQIALGILRVKFPDRLA